MPRPQKCPIPRRCGGRWHLTAWSQEECEHNQRVAEHLAELKADGPLEPWARRRHLLQELQDKKQHATDAAKRATAIANHQYIQPPSGSVDAVLARNGERQLRNLDPGHLRTLGLLLVTDIFRINRILRQGGSLDAAPGMMLDWNGYESLQRFVDNVDLMFTNLGDAVQLDQPMRVFRGIDVPVTPTVHSPDVADIGVHLSSQEPWQKTFVDRGIGFATTQAADALYYPPANHKTAGRNAVLLELEVSRALCLPALDNQSPTLFERLTGITYLDTAVPHLIFPRGTSWDITSIEPQSPHGVPVVKMHQR